MKRSLEAVAASLFYIPKILISKKKREWGHWRPLSLSCRGISLMETWSCWRFPWRWLERKPKNFVLENLEMRSIKIITSFHLQALAVKPTDGQEDWGAWLLPFKWFTLFSLLLTLWGLFVFVFSFSGNHINSYKTANLNEPCSGSVFAP